MSVVKLVSVNVVCAAEGSARANRNAKEIDREIVRSIFGLRLRVPGEVCAIRCSAARGSCQ